MWLITVLIRQEQTKFEQPESTYGFRTSAEVDHNYCNRTLYLFTQPPMRRMRICFADVFNFFAFSVRHKNTRQPFSGTAERIFMKLLPNDSGENGVCIAVPKWGLGPRLFWGAKNYTLRTWWCRLASDSDLVCWLWHCAATAVALKRHERANAFNL